MFIVLHLSLLLIDVKNACEYFCSIKSQIKIFESVTDPLAFKLHICVLFLNLYKLLKSGDCIVCTSCVVVQAVMDSKTACIALSTVPQQFCLTITASTYFGH